VAEQPARSAFGTAPLSIVCLDGGPVPARIDARGRIKSLQTRTFALNANTAFGADGAPGVGAAIVDDDQVAGWHRVEITSDTRQRPPAARAWADAWTSPAGSLTRMLPVTVPRAVRTSLPLTSMIPLTVKRKRRHVASAITAVTCRSLVPISVAHPCSSRVARRPVILIPAGADTTGGDDTVDVRAWAKSPVCVP
jgi:hypothetical protein